MSIPLAETKDIDSIVKVIASLKPVSNIFKDYLFPICSAFLSSLLGAGVAYFSFKYQDQIKIEKDKLNAANKWLLIAEEAFSSLIAIKNNYHGRLLDNPIQRFSQIPTIIDQPKPINEDLALLSFIVPKSVDDKFSIGKWSQLPRIRAMVSNYNCLLELWKKRNEIERPIKETIVTTFSNMGYANVNLNQITGCVGRANFISAIDLNERVIKLTDDIILEINDFMMNFPILAKSRIKINKLKKYGSVLTYSNDNKVLLEMIKRSPEVNYNILADLFGKTPDEIKIRYKTGYENS
jgi:hypothetical protein